MNLLRDDDLEHHEQIDNLDVGRVRDADTQDAVIIDEPKNEPRFKQDEEKLDSELIREFLKPNSTCVLCTTPLWAFRINKAYLDGLTYPQMIEQFSIKFEERVNRALSVSLLHRHFRSHFDARGAAIAQYNGRKINKNTIAPNAGQRDIFKLTSKKYIDELEMYDTTAKELINKYREIEDIIEDKRENGKKFGIDDLILKQAQMLALLNKQAISKFKALSRVDLESKQGQLLSQLSFIGNKALVGISQIDQKMLLSPKEMEEVYLSVVIKQILARMDDPLKILVKDISKDQKQLFYRELKKSIDGMQEGINVDFEKQIKTLSQKSIVDKRDSEE
jgi:hypothetical protein